MCFYSTPDKEDTDDCGDDDGVDVNLSDEEVEHVCDDAGEKKKKSKNLPDTRSPVPAPRRNSIFFSIVSLNSRTVHKYVRHSPALTQ